LNQVNLLKLALPHFIYYGCIWLRAMNSGLAYCTRLLPAKYQAMAYFEM